MQVRIRTKSATRYLPTVAHEGRTYLIAPAEGEYEIVLTNNCNQRRMAVIAVDGMSVMDGKLAKRGDQNGYVLGAWQTATIKGWRRSDQEVAAFAFTPNEGSYSNQAGNGTQNTGIISVAVFDEKVKPVVTIPREVHHHHHHDNYWWNITRNPYRHFSPPIVYGGALSNTAINGSLETTSATLSADTKSATRGVITEVMASSPVQNLADVDLGTGYGSQTEMRTTSTTFEVDSDTPAEIVLFYYGTRERLKSRNIPVDTAVLPVPEPNPFPGSTCPAPPGWAG